MAFASSFVMFGLGGCIFLKICLVSPLSSSAFPCFSCWHILSIWEIYLLTVGSLATITKFGPWPRAFSCASVREIFERLWTHFTWLLLLTDVVSVIFIVVVVGGGVPGFSLELTVVPFNWTFPSPPFWMLEWPPVLFCHKLSNFFFVSPWSCDAFSL